MVSNAAGSGIEVVDDTVGSGYRMVLSGERFEKEFGRKIFVSYEEGVKKTVQYMKKHSSSFLNPQDSGAGFGKSSVEKYLSNFLVACAVSGEFGLFYSILYVE